MLTPVDIQNKAFKGGIGYDKKDVETFMQNLSSDYEMLYRSNIELKDKIATLNESLQHYRATEDSMQKALTLSEKTAEETVIVANDKARQIITEAEKKAVSIVSAAEDELLETKSEILKLQHQYNKFKKQYNDVLHSQLKILNSEMIDIDLGDEFVSMYDNGFGSYAGGGHFGGLGNGGGYVGTLPSGFEQANQDSSYGRVSLNMDPFAEARNGGGRFSKQTSVKSKKKAEPKVAESQVTEPKVTEKPVESSVKTNKKDATVSGEVEDKVKKSTMLDSEDNHDEGFDFISESDDTVNYADMTSAHPDFPKEDNDNAAYSGEVEEKVNESTMLDSEDNYDEGFDFVVGNDNKEDDIPTILTGDNDVFEGDVEDNYTKSNLIGNEDNEEDGFTFL